MKLAGTYSLPFARTVVWSALMDPAVLAGTLPGCERLERLDEHRLAGAMRVKVGPVSGQFQGTVEMSELEPPSRYHMRLAGEGPNGFVKGEGAIQLDDADGGTLLRYDLDAEVGGRLAGVGQRLLESSAKVIAKQGLEGLDAQLRARAAAAAAATAASIVGDDRSAGASASLPTADAATMPPASASPPVVTGTGPAGAAFAGRFARDLAAELVPKSARPWVLVAGVVVFLVVVMIGVRACG